MGWNGTHQLVAYADGVNLQRDNIDAINKNIDILINGSSEVGLDTSTEKTKYMLLSCQQNAGQNWNIGAGKIV
jgi:hypothetical protein